MFKLYIKNLSVSLSLTSSKNEKIEHHIKMKTHKFVILRFLIMSDVNFLYVN